MQNKKWTDYGEDILSSVKKAVDTGDFSGLSRSIGNTINDALDGNFFHANNGNHGQTPPPNSNEKYTYDWREDLRRRNHCEAKYNYQRQHRPYDRREYQYYETQRQNLNRTSNQSWSQSSRATSNPENMNPQLYRCNVPGRYSGPVMTTLGIIFTALLGIGSFVTGLLTIIFHMTGVGFTTCFIMGAVTILLAMLLGPSIGMIVGGRKRAKRLEHFRIYVRQIGNRGYCQIEELARAVGKKTDVVKKELCAMLEDGFFLQGRMDRTGTTLITSNEAYEQYENAEKSRVMRETAERAPKEAAKEVDKSANADGIDEKVAAILEDGNRYVQHIRECNDAIPGVEMSNKLEKLEDIMRRIFAQVKKNPDSAEDLQKFMSYYLPTTTKLLDAYIEMDKQPTYGENMANTKREIEESLDTINAAFEKLFDGMFQDTAWDISSDISTMKTMMAQEGLTGGDDFKIN